MNQNSDKQISSTGGDPIVSREYRAAATERTPPALDSAVLEQARMMVRRPWAQGLIPLWIRPLAFVATLALSLALLLEWTRPENPESSADSSSEIEAPVMPPSQAADDNRKPAFERANGKVSAKMRPPGPGMSKPANPDAQASNGIAGEVRTDTTPVRAEDGGGNTIGSAGQKQQSGIPGAAAPAAVSAFGVASEAVSRPCVNEQEAGAGDWWQCIKDLEKAGRDEEARAEVELFRQVHPAFVPPGPR